jgi:4-amino-4-deoxy-L-arabinose transferase-like glycosyltransferase
MIPLTFLLGRALLPAAWALLPTLLVAISPQLIIAGTYVLSETLFSFLLLAALAALVLQYRRPESWAHAIASGALLGMAALTRPTLQYFLPCVLLVLIPMLPKELRWRQGISLCVGFAIIFVPWLLRNQWTLGMASDPTLAISTILHGHYPDFMYRNMPESLGYPYRFDPRAQEISANMATLLRELFARFTEDPAIYLRWYVFGKPIAFFSWGDAAAAGDIFTYPTMTSPYYDKSIFIFTKEFMKVSHWIWVAAALLGIFALLFSRDAHILNRRGRFAGLLLSAVVLYFVAVHVVGFPIARYNIPVLPIIYLLSAYLFFLLVDYFFFVPRKMAAH